MCGGLKAYIGAVDDVDGDAIPLFVAHFFHHLPRVEHCERRAWRHAASYDEESRLFALYDREGCHRVRGGRGRRERGHDPLWRGRIARDGGGVSSRRGFRPLEPGPRPHSARLPPRAPMSPSAATPRFRRSGYSGQSRPRP